MIIFQRDENLKRECVHLNFFLRGCLQRCKVAGVKVYTRQTWNFRAHAVSPCIGLWRHGSMHAVCTCICLWCMHQPVTSYADHVFAPCTYCMGFKVSSLSQIYLYSSYFERGVCFIHRYLMRKLFSVLCFSHCSNRLYQRARISFSYGLYQLKL